MSVAAVSWKSTDTDCAVTIRPTYNAKSRLASSNATAPNAEATSAARVSMRRSEAYL